MKLKIVSFEENEMQKTLEKQPITVGQHVNVGGRDFYSVWSSDGVTEYWVDVDEHGYGTSCTCPHHQFRFALCKHMLAVTEHCSKAKKEVEIPVAKQVISTFESEKAKMSRAHRKGEPLMEWKAKMQAAPLNKGGAFSILR